MCSSDLAPKFLRPRLPNVTILFEFFAAGAAILMTPTAYLNALPEPRRSEIKRLHAMIRKEAPALKPFVMQSMRSTFLGYGRHHYKTKSGCEGEWFVIGISNRKQYISLYVSCTKDGQYLAESYKKKLPKLKIGKSCICIKQLVDIDEAILRQLISEAATIGVH